MNLHELNWVDATDYLSVVTVRGDEMLVELRANEEKHLKFLEFVEVFLRPAQLADNSRFEDYLRDKLCAGNVKRYEDLCNRLEEDDPWYGIGLEIGDEPDLLYTAMFSFEDGLYSRVGTMILNTESCSEECLRRLDPKVFHDYYRGPIRRRVVAWGKREPITYLETRYGTLHERGDHLNAALNYWIIKTKVDRANGQR